MRKVIQLFWCLSGASVVLAQGFVPTVVPNGNAGLEGNSSMSDVFTSSSFRMQLVFDASQFAIPAGASGRIDSIWFRLDSGTISTPEMFFGGGSVTASLTPVGPDGLSSTFANNIGINPVTIFNGAMSFGGTLQPGVSPQPFRQTIIATSPFWYMPSQGNLLLDIRGVSGQAFFPGELDAQSTLGDSVSRVVAFSNFATSGTPDTLGLVTRFDFTVIPEPGAWALLLTGSAILLLSRRKK